MPAELSIWARYLSFSPLSVKIRPSRGRASHDGKEGLPEARLNRPSMVATASASLNLIQALSSFMKALSRI